MFPGQATRQAGKQNSYHMNNTHQFHFAVALENRFRNQMRFIDRFI